MLDPAAEAEVREEYVQTRSLSITVLTDVPQVRLAAFADSEAGCCLDSLLVIADAVAVAAVEQADKAGLAAHS